MAAGIGSRYGGLKQIEPIGPNGEIILDYSIYDAKQSGFGKIIFVINRGMEKAFRERIEQSIGKPFEIVYVYQDLDNLPDGFHVPQGRVKPWGTAHAVLSCREVVDTSFAVINADDFYGRSAYQSLANFLQHSRTQESGYNFCMVGYQLKNTLTKHGHVSRGICSVDQDWQLIEIHERTRIQVVDGKMKFSEDEQVWIEIPEDSLASMNIWGFTPELFDELDARFERFLGEIGENPTKAEYFLPVVVNQLLAENRASVKVLPTHEHWFGVTYQEDVERVRGAMQILIDQGIYPVKLWD
jgi:NDP-sugar pyrophosphorylase family protein